ncbi:MAG TPA: YcaO-like family protein, partial [Nitrososphaeraceae archaeon]|nr:YcaO-like family protein [Nitrososphaeraceae archaeon]
RDLQSRRKQVLSNGLMSTRVKPTQDTLNEIIQICNKIGITRISNITFMDRLGVPNFSAVLPGTEDIIWVYSGKGATIPDAKASALMEAIERYSSLPSSYARTFIRGSYSELSRSYNKVLHPGEVVEPLNSGFSEKECMIDFIPGFDLLTNETVLIPAEIALYRYSPKDGAFPVFSQFHTNGLASGNVLEEAVCHALCEVIERDAVSIADLCASCIPYTIIENIINSLKNERYGGYDLTSILIGDKFVDDPSIFPDVDIGEIVDEFKPIKNLVNRFSDIGIPLYIKDITQKDIGIPTFVASSIEWITDDYGYFARGYGTYPDSRIALIRAITEVSQTRAVNIQGSRDDLKKIEYKAYDEIYKRKWQFMHDSSSSVNRSNINETKMITFSKVNTYDNDDILKDIKLLLYRLKKAGLKRAIIVDLTNPNIGIPVVRAIVPGLETFEVTDSIIGRRAKEYFTNLGPQKQK